MKCSMTCNYASIMHSNAMTGKDAIAISTPEGATDSYKQSPEGGYVITRVFHCNFASLVSHFVSIKV